MDKEQCLKALKDYWKLFELHRKDYYLSKVREKEIINNIQCIENLIEEHFDNPPLHLNDLKNGETYWHVDYGWVMIKNVICYDRVIISTLKGEDYKRICFKENCFFRKRVEDE